MQEGWHGYLPKPFRFFRGKASFLRFQRVRDLKQICLPYRNKGPGNFVSYSYMTAHGTFSLGHSYGFGSAHVEPGFHCSKCKHAGSKYYTLPTNTSNQNIILHSFTPLIRIAPEGHICAQSPQPLQLPCMKGLSSPAGRKRAGQPSCFTQKPQPVQSSDSIL